MYAQPTHCEPKLRDRGGPCCKCTQIECNLVDYLVLCPEELNKERRNPPWKVELVKWATFSLRLLVEGLTAVSL